MYAGTELGRGAYRSGLSAETAFTPIALGRFADRFARDQCSINAISSSASKLYLSGDCQPLIVRTDDGAVEGAPLWPEPEQAYVSFYRHFAQHAVQPSSIDGKVSFRADAKGGFYTYDNPSAIPKRSKRAFPFEPGECRGFYISTQSSMTKLDEVRALLDSGKFNCVVVDMKDDFGRVPMEVTTPLTQRYGTRRSDWSISELGKLLSGYKVWKVARHVTMKDLHLVDATDGRLALLDIQSHRPWVGEDQDKWSDPYDQEVWEYNVEIASTYEALGFDEVQFDYIRFPSDIDRISSPAKADDTYQSEALASFLSYARTKTRLPVSIDIYGFSALYRTDSPIGQDLQLLAEYVDVISPMLYSSHFDHRYLAQGSLEQRAYHLLLHSTGRANVLARGRVVIRSWLQAFREQTELWGYGYTYFHGQTQGCLDAGSKGWLWWGPIEEMFGLP